MKIWIDAQLSPDLASWLSERFGVECRAVRDLGLRDAEDDEIFEAGWKVEAVVMTKDADFSVMVNRLGPPPQIIWITCGNTSNARLREILTRSLADAIVLLQAGEPLVEITG